MSPCSDKTERRFHLGQTARDEAEKCVGNGQKSSDDGSVDIDVELPYKIHRSNLAELVSDIIKGSLYDLEILAVLGILIAYFHIFIYRLKKYFIYI